MIRGHFAHLVEGDRNAETEETMDFGFEKSPAEESLALSRPHGGVAE